MPDLVERTAALDALEAALQTAADGRGSVVLVTGEAGIGKTALVTHFADRHRTDARVLMGLCDDLATPRPLSRWPGFPVTRRPTCCADRLQEWPMRPLRRFTVGDLTDVGLPAPDEGPFTRQRRPHDAGPAIVDREVGEDLRAGRIRVVAAVDRLDRDRAHLADGSSLRVDTVIAATGLRPGLDPLLSGLDVLDENGVPVAQDEKPALPGLRFVNFGMQPGLLAAAGQRARRTAAAIAREYREKDDEAERTGWLARRSGNG